MKKDMKKSGFEASDSFLIQSCIKLGYNYAFVKEDFPDGAVLNENADGIDYAAAGAYSAYVRCGGEIMGIVDNDLLDKGERAILKVWRSR